jgi:hypothetical protein
VPSLVVSLVEGSRKALYVVQIAWGDVMIVYVAFGVVLVGAVVILRALRRMNVFRAVKVGEVS